ncbi:class II aldolase/adducin family protein [Mesorhizobium sp. BH1-1-5]|uniref:class II aldolase/adducin family protein n=1 Tax=Mesorhizobium sp. BH1-1-5 TaxID=2876661 RepID=UPI001CCBC7D7|nr:class II aldolase/adducin family protein [Mesorhizobium sp. BH1-1-5]MBZ9986936.1 class II aldolase/adducin family protein [Mesorhizobium sp. BH1-1-5]
MTTDEDTPRQAIADTVRRLQDKGFNHGNSGNVSCRIAGGMLITPTGANSANLTPSKLIRVEEDGSTIGGIPSSEWHMHAAILNAYPAANAVIHTHADACVALACLRKPLPPFHYMVAAFGGADVRCAHYATFGTAGLGETAVEALKGRTACLLANHGMIAIGKTLEAAFQTTVKLETLARQYLMALQGGEPVLLPEAEMERVGKRYGNYVTGLLPG